ncbi:MAG: 1-phosphofructokinase [Capsulimonadaceae bacterium]|nr:1-phosphofructokinase [Capsulimonadaceae bacterium]
MKTDSQYDVATVTLNPAIDLTMTVPGFAAGGVNRAVQTLTHAGGKGVNVAAVLADYGFWVAATGFLGRENTGLFDGLFERRGIDNKFVRIPGATRTGIKIVDPNTGQTTDINLPGQEATSADMEILRQQMRSLDSEWVVLAGSVPPGVPAGVYRDLVVMLKQQGRRVALDTSGDPLQLAIDSGADVLKPNVAELSDLLGEPVATADQIVRAARSLVRRGAKLVVVSQGAAGAWFVSDDEAVLAKPPAVEVASTVGAGDAMVAGIVAAHLDELDLGDCARLATAFSLEAVGRVGAGLASRANTLKLAETVQLARAGEAICI